jgi:hypothetical protein
LDLETAYDYAYTVKIQTLNGISGTTGGVNGGFCIVKNHNDVLRFTFFALNSKYKRYFLSNSNAL